MSRLHRRARKCVKISTFVMFISGMSFVGTTLPAQTAPERVKLTAVTNTHFRSVASVLERSSHLLVSDPLAGAIRRITPQGSVEDLVAPNTIRAPGTLRAWNDRDVLVYGRGDGHFSIVNDAGNVNAAPASLRPPDGGRRIGLETDGQVADADGSLLWADLARGPVSNLFRRNAAGVVTTIATLRNAPTRVSREGGIGITLPIPFAPLDDWALAANGDVVIARGEPYRIDRVVDGAIRQGTTNRSYDGVPVTQADREAEKRSREQAQSRINIGNLPALVLPDDAYPSTKAAFARGALAVAPDGSAWIRRQGAAGAETTLVDVFNASGQFVRQVVLPADARIVGFGENRAFVAIADGKDRVRLEWFSWR